MTFPWATVLTGVTAVASAVTGGFAAQSSGRSARAADRSAEAADRSAEAAERSAAAAEALTSIERDRWHAELTPQLDITFDWPSKLLQVKLQGPVGLDRLDEVTVTVQDEAGVDHTGHSQLGGSVPVEELQAVVWSRWHFKRGVDQADNLGRSVAPFPLEPGDFRPLAMEPTLPPRWISDPEAWQQRFDGKPFRLKVTCRREGHHPWTLACELPELPRQTD
jgi:hypothetical protein